MAVWPAVEVDDAEPGVWGVDAGGDGVLEVAVQRIGGEWGGGGHDDGFGEEIVVEGVLRAWKGLGEGRSACKQREGFDPIDCLH